MQPEILSLRWNGTSTANWSFQPLNVFRYRFRWVPSRLKNKDQAFQGGRIDITELQEENAGVYSCVARNELGSAEDSIPVEILGKQILSLTQMSSCLVPPEINRENVELNRKLPTGRSTTLYCEASGKPTPKIKWFFNDTEINDAFDNIVMGTDNKYIQVSWLD